VVSDAKPGVAPRIYGSARQCWNPAPRYCAYPRLSLGWKLGPDVGCGALTSGWLRPGINGLGWNSIRTACNCRKSAAYRFAESHRARKHSHAGKEFDEVICTVLEHIGSEIISEVSSRSQEDAFLVPNMEVIST
jgi:hypothetical protein